MPLAQYIASSKQPSVDGAGSSNLETIRFCILRTAGVLSSAWPHLLQLREAEQAPEDLRKAGQALLELQNGPRKWEKTARTSRHKGVAPYYDGKWKAEIHYDGKSHNLGRDFDSEEAAARAFAAAAREHHGPNPAVNFPLSRIHI